MAKSEKVGMVLLVASTKDAFLQAVRSGPASANEASREIIYRARPTTNPANESTDERIERLDREERMAVAEKALAELGDELVCAPGVGKAEEIEGWLTRLVEKKEVVHARARVARRAGVPTEWCDHLVSRMTTFEGCDKQEKKVEGLATEVEYRAALEQRRKAAEEEARQAREAEARRLAEEQAARRLAEEQAAREHERRAREEKEKEAAASEGIVMATTSRGVSVRQEPYIDLPPVPGRDTRGGSKRKATGNPPLPSAKKAKGKKTVAESEGVGAHSVAELDKIAEYRRKGDPKAFDETNSSVCDMCAERGVACYGVPGVRCAPCAARRKGCGFAKQRGSAGGAGSEKGRVQQRGDDESWGNASAEEEEEDDRGNGSSNTRRAPRNMTVLTRQQRLERMGRRGRWRERMRMVEDQLERSMTRVRRVLLELADVRTQLALLRAEDQEASFGEEEGGWSD